jgi:hypothetical protein
MKKVLSILALALLAPFFAQAQETGLRFGLKIKPLVTMTRMMNADKEVITDETKPKSRMGFGGGLMVDYFFTENAGFQTGLEITSRGIRQEYSEPDFGFNVEATQNLTTVEIPLAFKMRSNEIGNGIFIRGLFGSSLNILTGARASTEINGSVNETRSRDNLSPLVADFLVGAGVEWNVNNVGTLDFGLSYHHGLGNINKREDKENDDYFRMNYLALDLGFLF